jgi:hypothetical protein
MYSLIHTMGTYCPYISIESVTACFSTIQTFLCHLDSTFYSKSTVS